MPRKNEDVKKNKKTKKEEVQKIEVDLDSIKDELYDYTDEMVRKYYLEEIEKINRVIIRHKNKKILFRNFIITLLLLIIVYLLYLLTTVNYFSSFSNSVVDSNSQKEEVKAVTEVKEKKKEPTLDELKETYSYLLDKIVINEKSSYLKDFYQGNLTKELKNYLALSNIDFKKIDEIDGYNMFSEAILKDAYENNLIGTYNSVTFKYNDNNIRYISKLNSYITDSLLTKTNTNIKREIIDVKVKDNEVNIVTIEGLVKDNKLYNVLSNQEITEYKGDNIINYRDKLNQLTYTFDNKKLSSIK